MATNLPSQQALIAGRKKLPIHGLLLILLTIFAVLKLVLNLALPRSSALASDLTVDNILQAVNSQRSQRNLTTLNTDGRLSSAAQSKADDMQARHYFAHVDPDGNYIWPKIAAAGYTPYLELGENLAIEFYDTDSLMSAWMNSPTHRANILNDGFKDQGMGLNFGDSNAGQYHSVVANTFGALLLKKVQPAPTAASGSAPPAVSPTAQPAVSGASQKARTQPAPFTQKPKAQPKPATSPAPSPATTQPAIVKPPQSNPAPETVANPLNPRGDYAMAQNPVQPGLNANPAPSATPATTQTTAPAVVNTQSQNPLANYQANRYLTLAFGIVLFLFLLTDLRDLVQKKSELVGKKINNLMLLFLALVVIAVMYWL